MNNWMNGLRAPRSLRIRQLADPQRNLSPFSQTQHWKNI